MGPARNTSSEAEMDGSMKAMEAMEVEVEVAMAAEAMAAEASQDTEEEEEEEVTSLPMSVAEDTEANLSLVMAEEVMEANRGTEVEVLVTEEEVQDMAKAAFLPLKVSVPRVGTTTLLKGTADMKADPRLESLARDVVTTTHITVEMISGVASKPLHMCSRKDLL